MRILVVEDEPRIASFVVRGLVEEGHRVHLAGDLAKARAALGGGVWDLLVVDRRLPDGDGLELVRELRRASRRIPVLCVTARDRVADRVEGLREGADDYLVKPFAFEELVARIDALHRRAGGPERVEIADLVVDVGARRAWRGGTELRLTSREFRLLHALAARAGRVVDRASLLEEVWDTRHDPGTNVVEVYVSYLRGKLDKGFSPPLLHTVRGEGYSLGDRSG